MKTIKLIIALFFLTTLVGCSEDEKYEKIEYNSVEDLMDYLVHNSIPLFSDINNVAYTIREDDLLDEYYNVAYEKSYSEYDIIDSEIIWFAYYFAETEQYCENQGKAFYSGCNIDGATVATDSYYKLTAMFIHDANKRVEKDGKFIFSPIKVYPVEKTETQLQAIEYAYIISQGEETLGYEEAMSWSYELAVSNGGAINKENFYEDYPDYMAKYQAELQKMQGEDIDWLVEHYDEYSEVIGIIDAELKL